MGFFRPKSKRADESSEWIWLEPNPDDPSRDPIDQDLALSFNEQQCRELRFIPISIEHGVVTIAAGDDGNAKRAREVVMDASRCAVAVYMCEAEQLDRALDRIHAGHGFFRSADPRDSGATLYDEPQFFQPAG